MEPETHTEGRECEGHGEGSVHRPRRGAVSDFELLASRLQNNTFLLFKQKKKKKGKE